MFDLGSGELLVIGVVALIVVGPKDLPILFRNIGRYVGKARGMAREFSRAMEAAADEAGVKDIDRTLKAAVNPKAMGLDALRDAAGLKGSPTAATATAAAAAAVKPGGETEALIKKRAADKAEAQRKATERAAARALGEPAPSPAPAIAAAPASAAAAAPAGAPETDGTA